MRSSSLALLLILATPFITAQMKVSNLDGPVTKSETASLLAYISAMQPAPSNKSNAWSYGTSGQAVRALALIYQINPDPQFIDQTVRFCDAHLAHATTSPPLPSASTPSGPTASIPPGQTPSQEIRSRPAASRVT